MENSEQKVKIKFKGIERFGIITERKLDKFKIKIFDGPVVIHHNWFQNNEFKRVWK